jgi:hypothetical protein
MTYTFATDAVSFQVDAATDDEAAVKFAESEGIRNVTTMGGLLGRIVEMGGYATVTDDRGDLVGQIDPDSGTIKTYPRG